MPNSRKIKARILEKGYTIGAIARQMRLSAYTLGRKISGKSPMTLAEAWDLMKILEIPESEFGDYFLQTKLRDTQQTVNANRPKRKK